MMGKQHTSPIQVMVNQCYVMLNEPQQLNGLITYILRILHMLDVERCN